MKTNGAMGDNVLKEIMGTYGETAEIWCGTEQDEDLIVADSSIFYNDVFPTLPDFPCMSSTSSNSSSKKFVSSSSSSASSASSTSWAVMNSDANQKQQGLRSMIKYDADCMDVMENFGYMDLIEDGNDGWDPSSIFQDDDDNQTNPQNQEMVGLDELGVMFFEWLKTNKEHISVEDMRNIKFKKATIECAYKRLGSTKEGTKQLLKLILEWVEQYLIHKKRTREAATTSHQVITNPNPNSNFTNFISTPDVNTWMWTPPTAQTCTDPETVAPAVSAPAGVTYYPFVGGANAAPMSCQPYPHQMPQTQFVSTPQYNSFSIAPGQPIAPVYGEQYPSQVYYGSNSERVVRLGPAATKEARKKRMARKKRGYSLHRRHPHQNQIQMIDSPQQGEGNKLGVENCTNNIKGDQASCVNWLYWPAVGAPMLAQPQQLEYPTLPPGPPVQAQSNNRQAQSERGQQQLKYQGSKGERNLKFLLQKVLKQSDVGNLGRIVLPKKEAETQLPQLEERDGIQIAMEDIGTSKVWNLRYRFWPNNKSRMYVLENTGEFVRANGLQEGDFIVIYTDTRYCKYMIRGVKVRQPVRGKFEVKSMRKNHCSSAKPLN